MTRPKNRSPAHKTLVFISDLHVGSAVGLTVAPQNPTQVKLLELYKSDIKGWEAPDILIVNGDAVDGTQYKCEGKGQTELNVNIQDKDAAALISMWKAKEIFLVSGTEYHTGLTDHEENIATILDNAKNKVSFLDKLNLKVNGWFKLQARHYVGSSKVPYSRGTAPAREAVSELLNAYVSGSQAANLLVFGHTHYYIAVEDDVTTAMILPCWQAIGSKFGDKKCSGRVVLGCVRIIVESTPEGGWRWEKKLHRAGLVQRCIQR